MRELIAKILRWQSKKYLNKNNTKSLLLTGSVGKTSTTQAYRYGAVRKFQVRKTLGNYNTDIGIPCSIFGSSIPVSLKNPFSWVFILLVKHQLGYVSKAPFKVLF
jgi:UDP-N-acetylmuramoylalanine-D-glutamate ligase